MDRLIFRAILATVVCDADVGTNATIFLYWAGSNFTNFIFEFGIEIEFNSFCSQKIINNISEHTIEKYIHNIIFPGKILW